MKFISMKAPNCVHFLLDGSAAEFEDGECVLDARYEDEMLAAGFFSEPEEVAVAPKPVAKAPAKRKKG